MSGSWTDLFANDVDHFEFNLNSPNLSAKPVKPSDASTTVIMSEPIPQEFKKIFTDTPDHPLNAAAGKHKLPLMRKPRPQASPISEVGDDDISVNVLRRALPLRFMQVDAHKTRRHTLHSRAFGND